MTITDRLRSASHLHDWIDELTRLGPPPQPFRMPSRREAAALLPRLAVPDEDAAEILSTLPAPDTDADLWWLLERSYHRLTAGLGDDEDFRHSEDGRGAWGRWPPLPDTFGSAGRLFYPHLFLAAVPAIRQWHAALGIDPDVSWATLQQLGRSISLHRDMYGVIGLEFPEWNVLPFRGGLFQLGRLQFRRGTSFWNHDETIAAGAPFAAGARVLDLHIPPTGPLTPAAVDDSFHAARRFFGHHFPGDDSPWAVCASWLLDPQLAEYLPADSNIIQFQRRFHLSPEWEHDGNAAVIKFVFRRVDASLDELPQRTTLQRAILTHIRAGRTWKTRRGWCPIA